MTRFKEALKQRQWAFDYMKVPNRVIVMSDDLDSLISCCFYSYLTGYPIGYFYDFKTMSGIDPKDTRERIYIDIAVRYGKCIDNHVQRFTLKSKVNNEAINFNSIYEIWRGNYYEKFAMSTLIMLYATYQSEIPLPKSEEGKMIILAIDSGYLGFYDNRYKEAFTHNLKELGLDELLEVLENHTLEEFNRLSNNLKTKIGEKIVRQDYTGELSFEYSTLRLEQVDRLLNTISNELGFPIVIPKAEFEEIQQFTLKYVNPDEVDDLMEDEKVMSFAFTGRDKVAVSYIHKRDMERMKKTGA